jgi:hypothetical protein
VFRSGNSNDHPINLQSRTAELGTLTLRKSSLSRGARGCGVQVTSGLRYSWRLYGLPF